MPPTRQFFFFPMTSRPSCISIVVANEIGNNHFRPHLLWCDVTGSKSFSQFGMHIQLLQSQASGPAGLFVHTQGDYPQFHLPQLYQVSDATLHTAIHTYCHAHIPHTTIHTYRILPYTHTAYYHTHIPHT